MLRLANLKIICIDSTEIFSKLRSLRSAGFEPSLAETKLAFFTDPYFAGASLMSIAN